MRCVNVCDIAELVIDEAVQTLQNNVKISDNTVDLMYEISNCIDDFSETYNCDSVEIEFVKDAAEFRISVVCPHDVVDKFNFDDCICTQKDKEPGLITIKVPVIMEAV